MISPCCSSLTLTSSVDLHFSNSSSFSLNRFICVWESHASQSGWMSGLIREKVVASYWARAIKGHCLEEKSDEAIRWLVIVEVLFNLHDTLKELWVRLGIKIMHYSGINCTKVEPSSRPIIYCICWWLSTECGHDYQLNSKGFHTCTILNYVIFGVHCLQ